MTRNTRNIVLAVQDTDPNHVLNIFCVHNTSRPNHVQHNIDRTIPPPETCPMYSSRAFVLVI